MISYKLGCSFELDLVESVCSLNEINDEIQITELFGSSKEHAPFAARPVFRLPKISRQHFENFINQCNKAGLVFNYTFNTIYPGTKNSLNKKRKYIHNLVKYFEDIGVEIITVGNPITAELIREASDTIELEVSTVAHIDAVTQIKMWKETYNVTKICANIMKNRTVGFLVNCSNYCKKNNVKLELIVNEFCGNSGGKGYNAYGTHCIFRDSCFLCHAGNKSKLDVDLLNGYPTEYCTSSKDEPSAWLKTRFIRPEDIEKYVEIGINNFKIAGRSGGTHHLIRAAKSYIKQSWEGNLLGLGKQIETVFSEGDEIEKNQLIYIENKKLDGFIDFWFKNPNFDCANEVCGETCKYCNEYWATKLKIN